MSEREWKTFYFNGNLWFGKVDSLDKFKEMLNAYEGQLTLDDILQAKRYTGQFIRDMPDFGFHPVYTGPQTFGEWLRENNIDLAAHGIVAK